MSSIPLPGSHLQSLRNTYASNLNYETEPFQLTHLLKGHDGCVNSLHWSQNGNLLLSGSDDTNVIVWDSRPGAVVKRIAKLRSGHKDNIFDAKFAPSCETERLVSVSRDGNVCIFDGWSQFREPRRSRDSVTEDSSKTIKFSDDTLKTVEFFDHSPHVFGVCSEDGRIYQYDCRADSKRAIVDLSEHQLSFYSMSACPSKPELLAVCGSDCFIRFYDRRKISPSSQDTVYCWTPPADTRRSISFFSGVRFSRFSYDVAAYGINQRPFVINPIFQCDEPMSFERLEDELDDFEIWHQIASLHAQGQYEDALPLLTSQLSRHTRMRVHPLWREIFYAELYNRALLTGLLNKPPRTLGSMHADLEAILSGDANPPAGVKYLQLMVILMLGDYEEFEALCDRFANLDDVDGLDFKIFKDILAVCEIDPAQINNLIPGSIAEVCKQLPFIDITSHPAAKRLKTKELGDFDGYLGCFERSFSRSTFKGVGFAGDRDQFVTVGCDGGYAFLYQNPAIFGRQYKKTPVWAAVGDSQITNVVEGHPHRPLIATSGLDHTIKLFQPTSSAPDYSTNDIDEGDLQSFKTFSGPELETLDATENRQENWFDTLYEGIRFVLVG